jgi:hypothetical protein
MFIWLEKTRHQFDLSIALKPSSSVRFQGSGPLEYQQQ